MQTSLVKDRYAFDSCPQKSTGAISVKSLFIFLCFAKIMFGMIPTISVGSTTRAVESGAAQSDRAHVARWAGAVGLSWRTIKVARPARRGREKETACEKSQRGKNENGRTSPEPSLAANGSGSRPEVLECNQNPGTRGAAGGAGLRSACATLRPPCVPRRQPGKQNENKPPRGRSLVS